jgi:hypothetical protein
VRGAFGVFRDLKFGFAMFVFIPDLVFEIEEARLFRKKQGQPLSGSPVLRLPVKKTVLVRKKPCYCSSLRMREDQDQRNNQCVNTQ